MENVEKYIYKKYTNNCYRPEIRGEPENQRVWREKLVLKNFRTEIDT